jgi:hypothetical protein
MTDELSESDPMRVSLIEKLRALDLRIESGLRARGFDPAQAENVPLPKALAELKAERDALAQQLVELEQEDNEHD